MLRKVPQLKRTALLFFFPCLVKSLKKLVNNMVVDHPKKCCLFSDFQYDFRSSWSTVDLLTVVSDTFVIGLGLLEYIERISEETFGLILPFLSNSLLSVVLDRTSSRIFTYAGIPQGYILDPRNFLLYISDLPDVIYIIAIYADDTTL